ncbi:MAG: hypothetical protein RLZZ502_580 [Pseudomonadota bacterium]|jgi:succinate dehydrogenase/fumarate reductase flavoprotein subunit
MNLPRIQSGPRAPAASGNDFDLLVIGSGAAGLSTALHAAVRGLRVCVLEKTSNIGGTSAISGGWMWLPRNHLAQAAGISDPSADTYLQQELGAYYRAASVAHFLASAPLALQALEKLGLRFVDGNMIPDFHGLQKGAMTGGRSACAAAFDGALLGPWLSCLRAPIPETTLWGMSIAAGADMRLFFKAGRDLPAAWYVGKRLMRYFWQKIRHGRNTHLVNGQSLVAQLLYFCLQRGVCIYTEQEVIKLVQEQVGQDRRVLGVETASHAFSASRGVVLACGGFPHDYLRQKDYLPFQAHYSAAPKTNTGDGLRLAESLGAQVADATQLAAAAAWVPVSQVPQKDGSVVHFPHLVERGKPGLIAVTAKGKRFGNEANSYYDMMSALLAENETHAYLIADHRFVRRYGLGAVKPWPMPLGRFVKNAYLKRAASIAELAELCAIEREALCQTVATFNTHARDGSDPLFHRGETPYNCMQGDAEQLPNPCVAPLLKAPFYAVRIELGSLGTFAGIQCDEHGRVLDTQQQVIAGLFAVGNDRNSVMGGYYPAGGITLGPAIAFSYSLAQYV